MASTPLPSPTAPLPRHPHMPPPVHTCAPPVRVSSSPPPPPPLRVVYCLPLTGSMTLLRPAHHSYSMTHPISAVICMQLQPAWGLATGPYPICSCSYSLLGDWTLPTSATHMHAATACSGSGDCGPYPHQQVTCMQLQPARMLYSHRHPLLTGSKQTTPGPALRHQ